MKKQLLIAGFSFLFLSNVNAGIVYTDIADKTLSAANATVELDLNDDGTNDFTFFQDEFTGVVLSYAGADVVTVSTDEWDVIKGLDINTPINTTAGFYAGVDAYINPFWATYVFSTNTDKYLGIRIIKNTQTFYGWIRISVGTNEVTFKDFAYESIAGNAINVGDHGSVATAIASAALAVEVKLYPNPTTEQLYIESPELLDEITVTDFAGHVVNHTEDAQNRQVVLNVENLENGVYFLSVRSGEKKTSSKFYKK